MLIQNTSSGVSAPGYTSDSGPVTVAVPPAQAAQNVPPQVAVKAASATEPTTEQLKAAVDTINSEVQKSNPNVEFSIDQSTKQTVIKVMDSQTGDLITQFPSKAALAVSQMIGQAQKGALLKQQA